MILYHRYTVRMSTLKTYGVFFVFMVSTDLKFLPLPVFLIVSFCNQSSMCVWSKLESVEKFLMVNGVF